MPPNTVKVTRPGPYGNPFRVGDDYGAGPLTAKDAVELFRVDPLCFPIHRAAKVYLAGKNLACWCKPGQPCHADVLLAVANGWKVKI